MSSLPRRFTDVKWNKTMYLMTLRQERRLRKRLETLAPGFVEEAREEVGLTITDRKETSNHE